MRLYFTLSLFLLLIASPGIGRDTVESKKKAKWKNACSDILIRPNQKHKYFRLALNYENRDSFIMALRIYTVLKRLSPDTNTVFMRKVKASYVETEKKELVVLKNRLLGKYTWTWSGSNWGTDD
ncbi:MAG: hypothetical protein JWO06_316, partial [Bacteroidota bacterium]|nr:hypothetical protein [Bacteroidota bacterium]